MNCSFLRNLRRKIPMSAVIHYLLGIHLKEVVFTDDDYFLIHARRKFQSDAVDCAKRPFLKNNSQHTIKSSSKLDYSVLTKTH